MSATPLKPCPFCGATMLSLKRAESGSRYVQCRDCLGASGPRCEPETAELDWNTRAAAPAWIACASERAPHDEVVAVIYLGQRTAGELRRCKGGGSQWYVMGRMAKEAPTHWMPLPAAPIAGKEGAL